MAFRMATAAVLWASWQHPVISVLQKRQCKNHHFEDTINKVHIF